MIRREENVPEEVGPVSLRHRLEYLGFRLLLFILSRLSQKGTIRLGRLLGGIAFDWFRLRRRVTLDNLSHAFPDWSRERRTQVARQCYRHFGITFLEICRFPRMDKRQIVERVRFNDLGIFARARVGGHGAVLLTGHFGNWEMVGAAISGHGHPISVVVRPQRNRLIDAHVTRARLSAGMRVLTMRGGLRSGLRALRANEFLALLSDQDAGREGIFVPFLGRLASTPIGPARFARMAPCPIIMGFAIRGEDGDYVGQFYPPIEVRADLPREEAEMEATRRTVEVLEDMIRRHPEQWFWMHRRWKTRPLEEKSRGELIPQKEV